MLWDFVEDDVDDSAVWDGVPNHISDPGGELGTESEISFRTDLK
jgi:hypothetical protein